MFMSGLHILRDRANKLLYVSQSLYICLRRFGYENCTPISISTNPNIHLGEDLQLTGTKDFDHNVLYAEAVGIL
jgi:hypothetical protein